MQFIFCATTGRSGTELLSRVLSKCVDCCAEHEPQPVMKGHILRALMSPLPVRRALGSRKARGVRHRAALSGKNVYADMSHIFTRYGAEVLKTLGAEACTVVHLFRSPLAVVQSYYSLGAIPYFTPVGTSWMGSPMFRGAVLRFRPEDWYQALAWHVFETELRYALLKRAAPTCRFVELSFEVLTDERAATEWLGSNGLVPGPEIGRVWAQPVNSKSCEKQFSANADLAREALEKVAILAARRARKAGVELGVEPGQLAEETA